MLFLSPLTLVYGCFVALVLGLCLGSFLCCAGQRAAHGETALAGRSHCDACGHALGLRDLVPVLSYVRIRGKCRYCAATLPKTMLLAELLTAAVTVALLLRFDISLQFCEGLLLSCVLLACTFADLEGYIIPDRFLLYGIVFRAAFVLLSGDVWAETLSSLLGGASVAAAVLLVSWGMSRLLKREAMGGGDIKLLFVTGLYLGWQRNVLCLLLSCVAGIVFGVAVGRRKRARAAAGTLPVEEGEAAAERADVKLFPWGPSIALGAWVAFLFGQQVIDWYMALFTI